MGATLDRNPIPSYAVTLWRGEHDIFVALPMTKGGPPYICRYPLSEGGLAAALEVLTKRRHEVLSPASPATPYQPPTNQPQVRTSKAHERLLAETTPEQRENARKLLAKLGIK